MQFTYWYRIGGDNRFIDPLQSTNPHVVLDKMKKVFGEENMHKPSIGKNAEFLAEAIESRLFEGPGISKVLRADLASYNRPYESIGLSYLGEIILDTIVDRKQYTMRNKPIIEFENALDFKRYGNRYYVLTQNQEVYRSSPIIFPQTGEFIKALDLSGIAAWEKKILSNTIIIAPSFASDMMIGLTEKGQFFRTDGNFRHEDLGITTYPESIKIEQDGSNTYCVYLNKDRKLCITTIRETFANVISNMVKTLTIEEFQVETMVEYKTVVKPNYRESIFHEIYFIDANKRYFRTTVEMGRYSPEITHLEIDLDSYVSIATSSYSRAVSNLFPGEPPYILARGKGKYEFPFKNTHLEYLRGTPYLRGRFIE